MSRTIKFIKKKPTMYYQVTTCFIRDDIDTEYQEWLGTDFEQAKKEWIQCVKEMKQETIFCGEQILVYLNQAEGKETLVGEDYYYWECVQYWSDRD